MMMIKGYFALGVAVRISPNLSIGGVSIRVTLTECLPMFMIIALRLHMIQVVGAHWHVWTVKHIR
jgi:hypothetical protein